MSQNNNKNKQLNENYSSVGKISIRKYPIIFQKDEIIKGNQKKYKIKNIFTPDETKKNDKLEEYYTLFNKYQLNKNNQNSLKKKKSKLEFHQSMKNNPKLIYHNKHFYSKEKKKSLTIEINSCSYAPKYDFIKPRLLTGPIWKNIKGRNQKKKEIDLRKYYINKIDLLKNPDSKCLVNLNKTTQRGDFINYKNIRLRNETNFIKKDKNIDEENYKKISLFMNLSNINEKYFVNKYKSYFSENNIHNKKKYKNNKLLKKTRNNNNNNYMSIHSNDVFYKTHSNFNYNLNQKQNFFEEEKSINYKKSNKTINTTIENSYYNNRYINIKTNNTRIGTENSYSITGKKEIKNKALDFNKILSRDKFYRSKSNIKFRIPFITPNYSLIRERPIVMAIYKKFSKKEKNNNPKLNIKGIDYKIKYDPDKIINKYNNHLNVNSLNFDNMLSRDYSEKKNPLPSYMKDIFDRGAIYRITEKTLKLNKYREGKMSPAASSFLPKKSFNNIININMINSKSFKEKINDEYIDKKKELLKTEVERKNKNDEINNLKDLGILTHFENFTYKTIEKRDSIQENNKNNNNFKKILSNFLIN